jgi:hypothetical protein
MSIQVNVHAHKGTDIVRNLPSGAANGGWLTIHTRSGADVTIFPPHDDPAAFWRYLANVASDMATYAEAEGK